MSKSTVDTEIRIRITDDEYQFIRDLSRAQLRSESNLVRYLIHKEMMAVNAGNDTAIVRHLSS